MVALRLFGAPRAGPDDAATTLPASKPVALLLYLAQRGEWVARVELATLFWPDADERAAHHALRQLVYRARRLPLAEGLEVSDTHLRWRVESDVADFRRAIATSAWSAAGAAYGGTFLDGLRLSDAPGFDAWLELEREATARSFRDAAVRAAAGYELHRDYEAAVRVLEAAVGLDPLDEELARGLVRCLALDGRPAAATAAAERLRDTLRAELGLELDDATRELAERVRQGAPLTVQAHNLPGQTSPFVGRGAELFEVARRLADPACRMLTITGPGGVGKTRLALQAAAGQVGAFRDGVYVVALADAACAPEPCAASAGTVLARAIADARGIAVPERADARTRVLAALESLELLLVLDNAETVRGDAPWLAELLRRAPGVTLLATSREPLEVAAEWRMPIGGLDLPAEDGEPGAAGSVRLYLQEAERVRPGAGGDPTEHVDVGRICRLVDGLPLAIELAAGWSHLLAPAEIADEIERDLDFLRSHRGDQPARHQSLRAVFDASWSRASGADRELALRLAPFAGEVDLAAVVAVAGPALDALSALVKRAFLRRNARGRFETHGLVRQYLAEELARHPDLAREAARRHARHVAERLAAWARERAADAAFDGVVGLLPDAGRAWATLVAERDWPTLVAMLPAAYEAHDARARIRPYLAWIDAAMRAAPTDDDVRGRLLAHRAACLQRLGRYAEGDVAGRTALGLLAGAPPSVDHWVAWRALGNAAFLRGDLSDADEAFRRGLEVAEHLGHRRYAAGCLSNLGLVHKDIGDLDAALAFLRRARSVADGLDDAIRSQVLNNLATVLARRGDLGEAEGLLRESAELKRRLGDDRGLAAVLTNVANLRSRAADLDDAERLHRDALRLAEAVGDPTGVARGHTNLGDVAFARGDLEAAIASYRRSLALKRELDERRGAVLAYVQLVACHARAGDEDAARSLAEEGAAFAREAGQAALEPQLWRALDAGRSPPRARAEPA